VFFSHTQKKKTKLRSPKEEIISWTLHKFSLHCIVAYKTCIYFIFRVKFACPCIPKLMFHIRLWVHRFLIIYQFPKSNCMIHRTQRPLFFFIGLNVLCFMFQKTTMSLALWFQRLQCLLSFLFLKDFNVFCLFCFQKISMSSVLWFKDYNVFSLLQFQRLQCL